VRGVLEGLAGGHGEGPAEGVARGELTVVDMEASLEHLSRGTLRHADVLLIVVEPYYRALETAGRTVRLARELGMQHIFAVANKVRTAADGQAIVDYCAGSDLEVLASIPYDEAVMAADRAGLALLDQAPDGPAVAALTGLVAALERRILAGQPA
jgi:CO dehydrogenase maturation factor